MKKEFLLAGFMVVCLVSATCNSSQSVSIVGRWKPVGLDNKYILTYHLDNAGIQDILEHNSIEFTSDGHFATYAPHDTTQGTYTYDEKGKRLTALPSSGDKIEFAVFMDNGELSLTSSTGKIIFTRK